MIADLPELRALDHRRQIVRIPHETDVPLTDRVRALLDSPEFRRLARVSQLGLVSLVYPAANHTRLEHSLGVYRNSLLYLKQLAGDWITDILRAKPNPSAYPGGEYYEKTKAAGTITTLTGTA